MPELLRQSAQKVWLHAWHDPVAGLKAFSPCVRFADLSGDGDTKMLVANADKKMKIYTNQTLLSENALLDAPVSICTFYPDAKASPRVPSVGEDVAAEGGRGKAAGLRRRADSRDGDALGVGLGVLEPVGLVGVHELDSEPLEPRGLLVPARGGRCIRCAQPLELGHVGAERVPLLL